MRRQDDYSHGVFIIQHLLWGALWAYLYHSVCFRCIPGLSLTQSRLCFWGLLVGLVLLGVCLTIRWQKNDLNLFINVSVPMALYFMISYWDIHGKNMAIGLSIITLLLLGYAAAVMGNWLRDRRNGTKTVRWQRCVGSILRAGRVMVGLVLAVSITVFVFYLVLGGSLVSSSAQAISPETESVTMEDHMETLCLLEEERWALLDPEEKLTVLQTVANIEVSRLGLSHELNLRAAPLGELLLGQYVDDTHEIMLNVELLTTATAHAALEVVAHEAHHAYEWRLIDLYESCDAEKQKLMIFDDARQYQVEFSQYVSGVDDFLGYLEQSVEIDSQVYAYLTVENYYDKIEVYLLSNP